MRVYYSKFFYPMREKKADLGYSKNYFGNNKFCNFLYKPGG